MRDRRSGEAARHRPVRDAAQERGAAGRQDRIDLEGADRRQLRQLWHRRMPRYRRAGAAQGQRRRQARRRGMGRGPGRRAGHAGMRAADRASLGAPNDAAAGRHLSSRLRLDRNGQRHHSRRTSRSPRRFWARGADRIDIINADTDRTPYDTGTFASTGTVVGGKAVHLAAEAMRTTSSTSPAATPAWQRSAAASTTTA